MEDKNYCVYKHTTPSGKVYIGITKNKATYRWGHDGNGYGKQVFGRAVEKYGWDNINHEVLFFNLTKEEAEEKEKQLIKEYRANEKDYGYNCTDGGGLCSFNEETKMRIKTALTGRTLSDEHKANIARCRTGWEFSEETRNKISVARRGKPVRAETKEAQKKSHQWQAKRVAKLTMDGNLVEVFNSVGDAATATGCSKYLIRRVCQGKRQSTNGYKWAFYEGGEC